MINQINHQYLTDLERRAIFERARLTNPYFNMLEFPIAAEVVKRPQYEEKLDVNKDFWLTEVMGNFGRVFDETASAFTVSLYSQLQSSSLWKYIQSVGLESGLVMNEARFQQSIATQIFDDRQYEYMPRLIRAGDRIIGRLQNLADKTDVSNAQIVLKGYYNGKNEYLNFDSQRGITDTFKKPIQFNEWRIRVNHGDGKFVYRFENDKFARLVLGFKVIDNTEIAQNAESLVTISDNFKELRWNNVPIPIEFFAPRLPVVRDSDFYYLPIEYFWESFSTLKFEIDNDQNGEGYYDIIMLTRTI